VAMLAGGCAARGMAVRVFGPAGTGRRFFAGTAGVEFEPVEIADRPRPGRDAAAVLRLRRLLRHWGPDVVHAHGLRAGAVAALAVAPRLPLAVTVHNAPPAGGAAGAVYAVLERIVARRAAAVCCVSSDLAERMRRLGARGVQRALVPAPTTPPPTPAAVAAARADLGEGPAVLAAGRLAAQKGFGVLLEAAAGWQDRVPVPVLSVAGEGPLEADLRARAQGMAVRFLRHRTDVPALLAAADVVVVASHWEGQPLIVQEALAAGAPLVASRTGGIPDLTGEDGALLVPPGDAGALAAAVAAVLDDEGLAAKLRAGAAARGAALPGEEAAVEAVAGLYQRLAAPGTRH
jgi:glycosyltransferase involved in cell wall biosynthesis